MKRYGNCGVAWAVFSAAVCVAVYGCSLHGFGATRVMPTPPKLGVQVDRAARALTGNALMGLFAPDEVSGRLKETYNRGAVADWPQLAAEIARGLAMYDGFDGIRGNQWLAGPEGESGRRYQALAQVLADDRLWVNSASTKCSRYLAVELAQFVKPSTPIDDCGGRTPNYDAVDVFRALLVNGTATGVEDGVDRDDRTHSTTAFPFLAPP